jgi:hypothetical protein
LHQDFVASAEDFLDRRFRRDPAATAFEPRAILERELFLTAASGTRLGRTPEAHFAFDGRDLFDFAADLFFQLGIDRVLGISLYCSEG